MTCLFFCCILLYMARDTRSISNICPHCFSTLDKYGFCLRCRKRAVNVDGSRLTLHPKTLLQNRYLLGNPLGVGGFGITYLAWDMETSEKVALKEFFPKGYTTRVPFSPQVTVLNATYAPAFNHWLSAFIDEAQVLTKIAHMHGVVKIQDFFTANNTAYIVMEYLDGISLRQYLIARGGRIPVKETLNIMRPVLESLLVLHQYGIIHKDISPANIQIVKNRIVKLIDFGAASIYNMNVAKPYIVLKHGFSPVELYATAQPQGPWSDVYQIGATIYNCLTGIIPPPAPVRRQGDTLMKPSAYGVVIPAVQENCLMKSLNVQAKDRYDNIGAFIQMLYGEFLPPPIPNVTVAKNK